MQSRAMISSVDGNNGFSGAALELAVTEMGQETDRVTASDKMSEGFTLAGTGLQVQEMFCQSAGVK